MTSVLNVDTIAAKDGTSPVALTKQSAAKAWINFDGTSTGAVSTYARDSFNASVITDSGTGDYVIGYTSVFANANYSPSGVIGGTTGAPRDLTARSFATSSMALYTTNSSEVVFDCDTICLSFHGDLA